MNFGKLLRQGKRRFKTKNVNGKWGSCHYCETRQLLFPYRDNKDELWMLCDRCTDFFVEEEE